MRNRIILSFSTTMVLSLWALSSIGATITVTAEGAVSEVLSTDDYYDLDGASYSLEFSYDTESAPTNTVCNVVACQTVFDSVGVATLTIYGRPNGAADAMETYSGTYLVNNYFTVDDSVTFPQGALSGDLDGLSVGNGIGVVVGDENYFSGTEPVLQTPILSIGQAVGGTNYGLVGPGGNYFGNSYYLLDGQVTSVSAVPLPASAWLLSSAIGILGWMRRLRRVSRATKRAHRWLAGTLLVAWSFGAGATTTVVSDEDFDAGATGWSNNSTTSFGGDVILGGYATFGIGDVISKNYLVSGGESTINLEFDFYRIDSWDNEDFTVSANGEIVAQDTYGFSGTSNLGGGPFGDDIVHFSLAFDLNATNLLLTFSTNLNQATTDESWGIDNLLITQTVSAVPVPAAIWLFGSALLGLGRMRRKQAA
ncbi:MAG: VPLPA-CTERM sorting domain-containing protein [Gammaproteobacteria bacterium]|nr:VPLPA-CTERM sorting domain-containing protein [Gammaproteobacteria bacterium]